MERVDAHIDARGVDGYFVRTVDDPANRAIGFYEANGFDKHLKQALDLNSNFHPVYAAEAKDTLNLLVGQSLYDDDDRDAEI